MLKLILGLWPRRLPDRALGYRPKQLTSSRGCASRGGILHLERQLRFETNNPTYMCDELGAYA